MRTAYIFDLDGTLANTMESLIYSVKATLREMGLAKITDEQCRRFVGMAPGILWITRSGQPGMKRESGWRRPCRYTGAYLTPTVHIM